jgi:outer membrane scaffolding protein for murein synthesis (MipA/OmpV family)
MESRSGDAMDDLLEGLMRALSHPLPLLAAALVTGAAPARAADAQGAAQNERSLLFDPGWIATVQLGPGVTPAFPGAGRLRPVPIPSLDLRAPGEKERFAAPDDSFGLAILDANGFRAGPAGNLLAPRRISYPQGAGLARRGLGVEAGGFVEYFASDNLRLRGELRQGFSGHHGLVGNLGADAIQRVGAVQLSLGPRLTLASRRYSEPYFGVTPYEAYVNRALWPQGGVKAYRPGGGLYSAGAMATARYDFSEMTNVTAYASAARLAGAAGASPITLGLGSRTQVTAGLLLARSFRLPGF